MLDELKNRDDTEGVKRYFQEKDRLNELLIHEETYWKHNTKIFWLAEGDSNSKYFHAIASLRKKSNYVAYLKDEKGEIVDDHDEMCSMVKEHYKNVFVNPDENRLAASSSGGAVMTDTHNARLTAD